MKNVVEHLKNSGKSALISVFSEIRSGFFLSFIFFLYHIEIHYCSINFYMNRFIMSIAIKKFDCVTILSQNSNFQAQQQ